MISVPRPPRPDENLVLFTDTRTIQDCTACPPFDLLDPEQIRNRILSMYGPDASGQVMPARLAVHTFAELQEMLLFGDSELEQRINSADWIVFLMLSYAPEEQPSSGVLKQFLRERAAGLETQDVIVMAHGAPYYLDTTEVSKLAAYYRHLWQDRALCRGRP